MSIVENRSNNTSLSESNINSSATAKSMNFLSSAKTLSLNLTLKLDQTNYIYWRVQVLIALDLEGFVNGK